MPNWAGSDWYFLRYCDNKNEKNLADMEKMKYWLPVDVYVGGDEHNTLHLLYSRFIYQFLYELGEVPKQHPEPYKKRLSHGVILAPDGKRMSKSKGNVIAPETMIERYGADVVRTYMMFMGPFDATMAWNERSLVGVKRFIEKFNNYVVEKTQKIKESKTQDSDDFVKVLVNKLVKVAGEDFSQFKFNTVVARLMETLNSLAKEELRIDKEELEKLVIILSIFAPFVTEELWAILGNADSVHSQLWPRMDEKYLVESEVSLSVAINGKMRAVIKVPVEAEEGAVVEVAKKEINVTKYLDGVEVIKTIYIKGKTINFVVK
jgi:leucyl-tRNA synthetase